MSNVITVENLGKKYTISHQQREEYSSLRDVISNGVRSLSKKVFSPFTPHSSPIPASEDFWALKDVSFEVKQGDRIGIIGRNGAGKSTLLKILSRITEPTTGSIRIKGRVASLLEVGTGFHPELTGRENIYLNGAILGMQREEIRKKFDEIVDFAEIEKFLDTPVKRYSSGMYVRLAFAVAAHLEPEILIVDEVLAVGDAQFQKKCLGKMEDVSAKEGRTVLFVSHNLGAICQLCNKGIYLHNGEIQILGDIRRVVESYSSQAAGRNDYLSVSDKPNSIATIVSASATIVSENNRKYLFIIDFCAKEQIRDIRIGMGINDKFGTRLTTLFSKFYDFKFIATNGNNRIYCEVQDLPLKTGSYSVNLFLGNGFETLDFIHDAFQLEVKTRDFFPTNLIPDDTQGGVLVFQKWWGDRSMERGNGKQWKQ